MKRGPLILLVVLLLGGAGLGYWVYRTWFHDETAQEITVLSYGGQFSEAQRRAYSDPFEKETKIQVRDATYNGEYGKLKAGVESGSVPDVVDIEASALLRGIKDNLFLPIDYSGINKGDLIPEAVNEYAVATDIYSVALGFSTKSFPAGGPQPNDWKDFWDVQKFPGARSLKKDPRFTLEIALMADGVPPAEVYKDGKLDVDRAFRSLDRIKKHVKVWWSSGNQPIQLLADGEVVMAAAFGARVYDAQTKDSRPVQVTWNQGILDIEYWAVLRGAKKPELSMKFIAFATQPKQQAAFSTEFPLGPINNKAFELIEPKRAAALNTYPDNLKRQIFLNARWWADHEAEITERFNTWLLKAPE